ncbi:MAG: hypothetical protein DRN04_05330 [Thermoprotei archaeon]|nr:MAG: hypothetical protein DRN04_05330 [Thermoprotei archaeon]
MILSIIYTWALMILFCVGFSIGYYSYRSIKRKFDEEYGKKGLLFKRVIHGIVYILLLSLVHEAVVVRLGENPLSKEVEALILLFLFFIGAPIFIDITLSLYKLAKKH